MLVSLAVVGARSCVNDRPNTCPVNKNTNGLYQICECPGQSRVYSECYNTGKAPPSDWGMIRCSDNTVCQQEKTVFGSTVTCVRKDDDSTTTTRATPKSKTTSSTTDTAPTSLPTSPPPALPSQPTLLPPVLPPVLPPAPIPPSNTPPQPNYPDDDTTDMSSQGHATLNHYAISPVVTIIMALSCGLYIAS